MKTRIKSYYNHFGTKVYVAQYKKFYMWWNIKGYWATRNIKDAQDAIDSYLRKNTMIGIIEYPVKEEK